VEVPVSASICGRAVRAESVVAEKSAHMVRGAPRARSLAVEVEASANIYDRAASARSLAVDA